MWCLTKKQRQKSIRKKAKQINKTVTGPFGFLYSEGIHEFLILFVALCPHTFLITFYDMEEIWKHILNPHLLDTIIIITITIIIE